MYVCKSTAPEVAILTWSLINDTSFIEMKTYGHLESIEAKRDKNRGEKIFYFIWKNVSIYTLWESSLMCSWKLLLSKVHWTTLYMCTLYLYFSRRISGFVECWQTYILSTYICRLIDLLQEAFGKKVEVCSNVSMVLMSMISILFLFFMLSPNKIRKSRKILR